MEKVGHLPSERRLGATLVFASTAAFALAGIFTKTVAADALAIACWRGLVGGLLIAAYVGWRGRHRPLRLAYRLGARGWLLAAIGAASGLAFISAFKHTFVANVAAIFATAPFLAAILARLLLAERFRRRTMLAAALSFAGVLVIVGGGFAGLSLFGDMLALEMTALCSLYLVLIKVFRDVAAVWAGAVSGLLLFVFGWLAGDPTTIAAGDIVNIVLFGCAYALAVILWTEGARLVPPAEAGLIGAAEIPFAALFALLFLGEIPPSASISGSAIVLAAVAWSSFTSAPETERRRGEG